MKKGFTLIEIIVCISVIAILGVASFFGIRLVSNNIRVDKLEEISERIITAAELYIEKNNETKNQLYEKNNGVVIPLNVLKDEGLLTLENTDIKDSDIKDEYVVALLGTEDPEDNECISTTIQKSWTVNNKPIYICTKSDGSSNLISVGNVGNNLSKANQEKFYFKGNVDNNYVKIDGKDSLYRILYIDTDDSMVLINTDGDFSGVFNNNQVLPIQGCSSFKRPNDSFSINKTHCYSDYVSIERSTYSSANYCSENTISSSVNGININYNDLENSVECILDFQDKSDYETFNGNIAGSGYTAPTYIPTSWLGYGSSSVKSGQWYKIHLASCMKISGGTGDIATPFIIKSSCQNV